MVTVCKSNCILYTGIVNMVQISSIGNNLGQQQQQQQQRPHRHHCTSSGIASCVRRAATRKTRAFLRFYIYSSPLYKSDPPSSAYSHRCLSVESLVCLFFIGVPLPTAPPPSSSTSAMFDLRSYSATQQHNHNVRSPPSIQIRGYSLRQTRLFAPI